MEKKSVMDLWKKFAVNTNVHGVKAASDGQRHIVVRWIWRLVLLSAVCMVTVTIVETAISLFRPKLGTRTTVLGERAQKFPAVTLCNINHFNMSYVRSNLEVRRWMAELYPRESRNLIYESDEQYEEAQKINLSAVNIRKHIEEGGFTPEETINTVWIFNDNGELERCNMSEAFEPLLTAYGSCFTFKLELWVGRTSKSNGIRLILDTNLREYFMSLANSMGIGFAIAIHDDFDLPFLSHHGLYLGPGTDSTISISRKRYDQGATNCTPEGQMTDEDRLYNRAYCMQRCRHELVVKECNCTEFYAGSDEKICRWRHEYNCLTRIDDAYVCSLKCEKSCTENSFDIDISAASFPSPAFQKYYNKSGLLALDVRYGTLRVAMVEQYITYTFYDFLGGMGGTLGLFLGSSLMCLLEVTEVSIHSLYIMISQVMNRKHPTPSTINDPEPKEQ